MTAAGYDGNDSVVLAEPGTVRPADRPLRMRRIVAPVAIAAVVVAVIVGIAGSLVSQRIAEQQAVHDVAQLTDVLAENVIQPALTDQVPSSPATARRLLDPIVKPGLLNGGLIRVKLWRPDGTIVYSDKPQLVGQRFDLGPEEQAALRSPRLEAGVSDLREPENRYERDHGKLLEVYRPVWTPDGQPLLFETYFRYTTVSARSHQLWRGFGGIMVSSLAALLLLLTPLAWALVVRARRARAQREELTDRALAASDEERRRIAATLHDGAVQQLAAASFTAAAYAERAATGPDRELAAGLAEVSATVRDSIAGLRSLLVDIYPPSLRTSGLSAALRDLTRSVTGNGATVRVEIDDVVADALPTATQQAVYRVAQEALRNAARHSVAQQVVLRLGAVDEQWAFLDVQDDGVGFDAAAVADRGAAGHFGVQLMADSAARCQARLTVSSAPGRGSRIRMEVPRS
jgi:signal transduction histidine kinase